MSAAKQPTNEPSPMVVYDRADDHTYYAPPGVIAAVGGSKVVILRADYDALVAKVETLSAKLADCEQAAKLAKRQAD